jgi:hypothetical protein
VIDLSKGNEPEDIPEYMNDVVTDDTLDDTTGSLDTNGNYVFLNSFIVCSDNNMTIHQNRARPTRTLMSE